MRGEDSRELATEPVRRHWGRAVEAELLSELDSAVGMGTSERAFALEVGVPRSTLRHWKVCKDGLDADPLLVYFLELPVGRAFLHRVVLAAHYVFSQIGPCGIQMINTFLKLAEISRFLAASTGSTYQVAMTMTEAIIVSGADECGALKRHVAVGLGAEHGPDLFHMQRELWQATEPALPPRPLRLHPRPPRPALPAQTTRRPDAPAYPCLDELKNEAVTGNMQLRNIGIVGYVGVYLFVAGLLGLLFYRARPVGA